MATGHKSKHTLSPRKFDKLPDLESVLYKQELIAFVMLSILAAMFALVIVL